MTGPLRGCRALALALALTMRVGVALPSLKVLLYGYSPFNIYKEVEACLSLCLAANPRANELPWPGFPCNGIRAEVRPDALPSDKSDKQGTTWEEGLCMQPVLCDTIRMCMRIDFGTPLSTLHCNPHIEQQRCWPEE
ncbi:hypothetical protein LX36DRAFT_332349 [Colletotrichum falcatum]|nr:hypothetical protein LX36DRAFT_332349 [Colletotrichum falcatum]